MKNVTEQNILDQKNGETDHFYDLVSVTCYMISHSATQWLTLLWKRSKDATKAPKAFESISEPNDFVAVILQIEHEVSALCYYVATVFSNFSTTKAGWARSGVDISPFCPPVSA